MTKLQVPNFTTTGAHKKDYYLLNGSPDFAVIPSGVIKGIDQAMPIRLPYGDTSFGAFHIKHKHGEWVTKNEPTACVATLVWKKLTQRGSMFIEVDSKLNLSLKINPSALLILKQLDGFYSVTTLYHHQRAAKGQLIGTYQGSVWGKRDFAPVAATPEHPELVERGMDLGKESQLLQPLNQTLESS